MCFSARPTLHRIWQMKSEYFRSEINAERKNHQQGNQKIYSLQSAKLTAAAAAAADTL